MQPAARRPAPLQLVREDGAKTGWRSRYRSAAGRCPPPAAMVLRKKFVCLWTLGLCLVVSKPYRKIPSITDQHFIDRCVAAHNEMRGKVQPPAADMKHMVRKNLAGVVFLSFPRR